MKDSAGTGDGAELALKRSRLDIRGRVLLRGQDGSRMSIPMEEFAEEAEMQCMIR